jgi:serine phosphatase RsbU (regulator of sigma subunit)/Tfp pilus assembly protein PilF
MLKQRFGALIIALLFTINGNAQNPRIDSLRTFLITAKDDTTKVKTILDLAFSIRLNDPDEGIKYALEGKKLAEELKWKVGIGKAYNTLGTTYKFKSDYPKALEQYQAALSIFEELDRKKDIATILMNIGSVYRPLKEYNKSLEYYKKALPIATELGAKKLRAQLLGNMGVVYFAQGNADKQLEVNKQALAIFREIKDKENEAWILSNTGDCLSDKGDYQRAMQYQDSAIAIYDELGILSYKSGSIDNIGQYYVMMAEKETDPALKTKYLKKSIDQFNAAKEILEKLNDPDYLKNEYMNLSKSQSLLGDYENALKNYITYTNLKDSVFTKESKESITKLETKRELELRDKEILIQQLKKRTERIYMFAGVFFLLVIIGFVTAGYRGQKKSKELISHQKNMVEEKQKEILDSINYAKKIQYALLAHHDFLKQHLPDHFVLFKPKDIVSGDFYWATSTEDYFYLAVCDSTGHGVPGAFMSLLSISFLNEAINEKRILQPNQVFNFVRKRLIDNVSGDGQKDGFDGILICLDKKNNKLTYSAANNAPLLIRNNELIKLEHDRMPVGAGEKKEEYRLFSVDLKENDLFYLYTDGFNDQFGGPDGKKFKNKNLNQRIFDIHGKSLQTQNTELYQIFNDWKGHLDQVDDVCLIGFKI